MFLNLEPKMSDAWGKHVATIFQSFIIVFPVHELNSIDKSISISDAEDFEPEVPVKVNDRWEGEDEEDVKVF